MYVLKDFDTLYSTLPNDTSKHILLGNGFSLSFLQNLGITNPKFSYSQIIGDIIVGSKNGTYTFNGDFEKAQQIADTYNLETIIEELYNLEKFSPVYNFDNSKINQDIQTLKDCLPTIISKYHPELPSQFTTDTSTISIGDDCYTSCGNFLKKFSTIFTLSYDLFLYWVINKGGLQRTFYDGFGNKGRTAPLIWRDTYSGNGFKKFYYLHGGLHYYKTYIEEEFVQSFETGYPVEKIEYDGQRSIIEQIKEMVADNKFPLVVVEGNSDEKRKKIIANDVLANGFSALSGVSGSVFIFGANLLSDEDNHLIQAMAKSSVQNIYYGLYGDDDLQNVCHQIKNKISGKFSSTNQPIIEFFDTSSMNVWQDYLPQN